MILRRVIAHFRKQEWTAIALDFLIVVAGILLAFQITEWSEERAERKRSQEYLSRIRADLMADMTELQRHRELWGQVAEEGYAAIEYAETGDRDDATEWEVLRSFLHASQAWQFTFIDATYSELRSAGELGLIPDADLRSALADYYVLVAARRGGSGPYHLLPDYREWVRGRMRSDVLRYYWQACFEQAAGVQILVECPPPEGATDLEKLLEELAADQAIIDALRYWIDTMSQAVELAGFDLGRAQLLIDRMDAKVDLVNNFETRLISTREKLFHAQIAAGFSFGDTTPPGRIIRLVRNDDALMAATKDYWSFTDALRGLLADAAQRADALLAQVEKERN
jgi:hypothetical protein